MPHPETRAPTPFALLETMRAEGWRVVLLEHHLDRLASSAARLGLPMREHAVRRAVAEAVEGLPVEGAYRLRLLLHTDGAVTTGATALDSLPEITTAAFYPHRVDLGGVFGRFKTTQRDLYDRALDWAAAQGVDEPLLVDRSGYVVEGARTNVWVRRGNRLLTPSLAGGGLAGVMRTRVLETRPEAEEAALTRGDLQTADEVLLSNAVRGLWPVRLVGPRGGDPGAVG